MAEAGYDSVAWCEVWWWRVRVLACQENGGLRLVTLPSQPPIPITRWGTPLPATAPPSSLPLNTDVLPTDALYRSLLHQLVHGANFQVHFYNRLHFDCFDEKIYGYLK